MADRTCPPPVIHAPKIVFIRLGKDKSKDLLQAEILKQVRKALRKPTDHETVRAKDKNCVTLSDLDAREIREVAIGPEYIGVLLKNGRVCRVRCISSNLSSSKKPSKPKPSSDEASFLVQSDEVYARRLQEQMNDPSSTLSRLDDAEPSESYFGPIRATLTDLSASGLIFDSLSPQPGRESRGHFGSTSSEVWRTASSERRVHEGRSLLSERTRSPNRDDQTNEGGGTGNLGTSANQTRATGSSPSTTNVVTAPPSNPQSRMQNNSQANNTSVRGTPSNNQRHGAARASPSMQSSVARRATSQLVLPRTFYSNEFPVLRMVRPLVFPPNVLISQRVIPFASLDARRLRDVHGTRSRPSYQSLQSRAHHVGPSSRHERSGGHRGTKSENTSPEENIAEFCYPQPGKIEWLEALSGEELLFTHIASMHSEFVLIQRTTGTLYCWPYSVDSIPSVSQETDTQSSSDGNQPSGVIPPAIPHPLLGQLGLSYESVSLLTTSSIRCTIVTAMGKVCTFYDKLLRESCSNGESPALIQELSHSTLSFSDLKGEKVVGVDCSDFFSCLTTQSGKVFWWGLLPLEECQDFKIKLNKVSNETCSIAVGDKVQLRRHLPGFPGALVFKSNDHRGPLVGRLVGHEQEDGSTAVVTKVKVDICHQSSGKVSQKSANVMPFASVQSETDILTSTAVGSPRSRILELERQSATTSQALETETWDVNEVVFLESESKVLGEVAAVDGPHVIVKVPNVPLSSDTSLRVFKLSELESVLGDASGTSATPQRSPSSLYRGCIQHMPKCILDAKRVFSQANKEVLTGLKPIAMTAMQSGISILVERISDGKAFYLGPVTDPANSTNKVYTCSSDTTSSTASDEGSFTVESESAPSKETALCQAHVLPRLSEMSSIGQKRKHSEKSPSNSPEASPSIALSNCDHLGSKYPLLEAVGDSGVVLLCDSNGCLYPRPYGSKLSSPCSRQQPPLHFLATGCRLVPSSVAERSGERMIAVVLAFKQQYLIPAIQSGIVSRVANMLNLLQSMNSQKDMGKGDKGLVKGRKKVVLSDKDGQRAENVLVPKLVGHSTVNAKINTEVLGILHEHCSSNQNILHVCCCNPAFVLDLEHVEVDKLLEQYSKVTSLDADKEQEIEVALLDLLLNHEAFGPEIVPMLKDRDAAGCTPFMAAIQCYNIKAALYILNFVEKHKDAIEPYKRCSLEEMIFPAAFTGVTPLHALAIACTESLPASGLGNSLLVTNLPSSYTPRILLKLFQARYPSAYRAAIPPLVERKKTRRAKTPRQRLLDLTQKGKEKKAAKKPEPKRTPSAASSAPPPPRTRRYGIECGGRIPTLTSRRESIQGMVTFGDAKEMRQALVEMDKHMVASEMTSSEGGMASLVQHVLYVKLAEVHNEDPEKTEMDVGIRGGVYSVSNTAGMTKISHKTQTNDAAVQREATMEDELICQLFSRLLSYPQVATCVNREGETVLAFLINNSRWIKRTAQQSLRLTKYTKRILGVDAAKETSQVAKPVGISDEMKAPGTADASSIENNLIEQLDDISQSFRSLVDTLTELEERCSAAQEERNEGTVDAEMESVETAKVPPVDGLAQSSASVPVQEEHSFNTLPVLIQLTQSWPCVAAVILGAFPNTTDPPQGDGQDECMPDAPKGHEGRMAPSPSEIIPGDSCNLDAFVFELVTYASEAVLMRFLETIIQEINKYAVDLTLEAVLQSQENGPWSERKVAFAVGLKFLRSVVRQMAVHLSRSGLSYVDLRSRIVTGSPTSSSRSGQNGNMEFKRKVRMILQAFSWLAVHELIESAEATILPVREGVAKPQTRSTGASVSNTVPQPMAMFPGARFRAHRSGIRVSGAHDSGSRANDPKLRNAYRLSEERATQGTPRLRGIRLATIANDAGTPVKKKNPSSVAMASSRTVRRQARRSSMIDSDSDTDDDIECVLGLDSDDMEIDEQEQDDVAVATGISRDHPYAWALDGRLSAVNESVNMPGHVYRLAAHYASSISSPPSVHTGNCYLARMFSRLVKEAVDLLKTPHDENSASSTDDLLLPVLRVSPEESASVESIVTGKLETSWRWLAGVLDIVEGQLQMGRTFDTKRYLASLHRPEENEVTFLSRSSTTLSGALPEEYLMFLLRAHSHEHSDSLPVMDMLCYEHTVYVLDAFIYTMSHWPKPQTDLDRTVSVSSLDLEEPISSASQSAEPGTSSLEPGHKSMAERKRRRKLSKDSEMFLKFFNMEVLGSEKEMFLNSLRDAVQHKFPKVPKATWEVFTHNVSVSRQKSSDDMAHARNAENDEEAALPVTYKDLSSVAYPTSLATHWSPDLVLSRWKISVDLFSRMFLADGPGAERDSFLAARAGVAGRLARFRRTISHLRETLTNDSQQANLGFGGLGGRVGTTLSLSIKRSRILEDTLRILGEMTTFHYCNFRARFEGEEGSGPGVNRGFFAAVANGLKTDEKPTETTSLLHEPGKLPEQSGFYAPKPCAYSGTQAQDRDAKSRRCKMFTAIGRFIGMSLWFNNTVPLNFSRHVIKYLLDRDVMWEDLAFFNADLFEGLSRMMLDAEHPLMTSECFQATYCCHFETTVGGTTEELLPGGSQIAVTPENIHTYVSLYATKVMIGCVDSDLRAMSNGLHDVIPVELLTSLTPEDFQLLLSGGTTDVDMNRLRSVISFTNSNGCSVDILDRFKRWFWSIVQKMTPLQRQQLLYFCTGSAVLPAVSDRRDPDQDFSITVDVISGNTKALPMATTCGQRMSIPLYPSKKILKRKLLQAIQCQSYGLG